MIAIARVGCCHPLQEEISLVVLPWNGGRHTGAHPTSELPKQLPRCPYDHLTNASSIHATMTHTRPVL